MSGSFPFLSSPKTVKETTSLAGLNLQIGDARPDLRRERDLPVVCTSCREPLVDSAGDRCPTDQPVRRRAEAHLRALVGRDDARLRDDQWTAIEALAVDRRRALVVQRTGWGKSAVYFVATAAAARGGRRPDRHRLARCSR